MPEPLASWNPRRDIWERYQMDLFSGRSGVYSEILPPSGMTRNGQLFELAMWVPPHPRARVFLAAYPAGDLWWLQHGEPRVASYTGSQGRGHAGHTVTGETPGGWTPAIDRGRHRTPLTGVVQLLPTPTSRDWKDTQIRREPHRPDDTDTLSRALADFGRYAPAIARWEQAIGRPTPSPTIFSPTTGNPQLSPLFTEWMMGLPEGWVTDPAMWEGYTDTATRNVCLRMAGNGVLPLQAASAIHIMRRRAITMAAA